MSEEEKDKKEEDKEEEGKEEEDTSSSSKGTTTTDNKSGCMTGLVAYNTLPCQVNQLVTTIKSQIDKGKLSKESKILLVDDLNVAAEDIPRLQVIKQLGEVEVSLGNQIEDNNTYIEKYFEKRVTQEIEKGEFAAEEEEEPTKEAAEEKEENIIAQIADIIIAKTTGATMTTITSAVEVVKNLAELFKAEYTLENKEISLSDTALRTLIAGKLQTELELSVYLPNFYFITDSDASEDSIITKLTKLFKKRWELQSQVHLFNMYIVDPIKKNITQLEEEINEQESESPNVQDNNSSKKPNSNPSPIVAKKRQLKNLEIDQLAAGKYVAQSESLITGFDEFNKTLRTVAEGQTASPLHLAVLREKILELGITHLLYATIVSTSGDKLRSKLWLRPPHMTYFGGSVISYILADANEGNIVAANAMIKLGQLDHKLQSRELSVSMPKLFSEEKCDDK